MARTVALAAVTLAVVMAFAPSFLTSGARAQTPDLPGVADAATNETDAAAAVTAGGAVTATQSSPSPFASSILTKVKDLPLGQTDEERKELAAVAEFYNGRAGAPLWVDTGGLSPRAVSTIAELRAADDWGLDASAFATPDMPPPSAASVIEPEAAANAELKLTAALLKYARFARGGRIIAPSESLNTNLDRRPQLLDPKVVLDGAAGATDGAAYVRSLHPQHPQFEKLRQAYVKLRASKSGQALAARVRANMEQWRWMAADMGDMHVLANVPEFMLRVYKAGDVIHSERIVAGEVGKQSSIFSRRLKHIVLRPMWRVPESIKVLELWPSLKRGGGLMRQYGLQLETKDGRKLDWRGIDWSTSDIRDYEVVQPPGRRSVLGNVKFSFPSQHTIYMHDTPDKWMFNSVRRTLSHGCLRIRNPLKLAEILLKADKGWDRSKIDQEIASGPLNNEVAIESRIPVHLTYFTAWVGDDGRLKTFADVYGHERRIVLALDGKWDRIDKGRDHLAPPQPASVSRPTASRNQSPDGRTANKQSDTFGDFLGSVLGGGP